MSKSWKQSMLGGGEGGSSSKPPKPQVNTADEELARKLNEELNAGLVEDANPKNDRHSKAGCPAEIQTAIDYAQRFADEVLSTTCHKCESPLIQDLDVPYWTQKWKAGQQMQTAPPASAMKCKCGATTCLGCAEKPRRGDPKYMSKRKDLTLDWCCNKGGVFVAWVLLCEYDNMELYLQAKGLENQDVMKQRYGHKGKGGGTGYGGGFGYYGFPMGGYGGYGRPGARQAFNFKQADSETDGSTQWILAMLIELLPTRNETSRKISPALSSTIELSLLQDRTAELLRNDSLQDVNKRFGLYFATFEFVSRLSQHPQLDYLVREERFVKKQSAGLHTIATAGSSKGKSYAQESLTVASRSEGMAASLVSCLSKLATQSKVLLSGPNSQAAGEDFREIAQKIDKLHSRLAVGTTKFAAVTTWKEYHQAHCLKRRADVARHLCSKMANQAQNVTNSNKGRMARLVTEASEMTTSLPENIFVMVDEALIVGPKGTPYEGGLFENDLEHRSNKRLRFDIVCGSEYPARSPKVWFLTTGQGKIRFNPNLYDTGKVCLSLLGTWPGSPETQWQPNRSTITSILVSIQSMILWKWPWENEPGHEDAHIKGAHYLNKCLEYNDQIRQWTIRYATIDWLKRKQMRDGLWKDVVRDYFRFCGRGVVESARLWEKGRKSNSIFGGLGSTSKALVDELETAIEAVRK
ncbi:MAG: hypothetical protein Q9181_003916 [Wetmoreana brouardii]